MRQGNITVQEYRLKFNQLSKHAPHMVTDSGAQMNKFFYGVSNLVKTEYRNIMLLEDMNISRLSLIPNNLRVIILGNKIRSIRRLGLGTMTILRRNRVVEIARRVSKSSQLQPLRRLVFHPPRTSMRKG